MILDSQTNKVYLAQGLRGYSEFVIGILSPFADPPIEGRESVRSANSPSEPKGLAMRYKHAMLRRCDDFVSPSEQLHFPVSKKGSPV